MNFHVLVISVFFLFFIQNFDGVYGEKNESILDDSSVSIEQIRVPSDSKIHSVLNQWQLSKDSEEFASENNLSTKDNKIRVYIYLQNRDSISKIPREIEIITFYDNVVDVFVSSNQLYELDKHDYVNKITPLILARTTTPHIQEDDKSKVKQDYLYLIGIGGISTIVVYLIYNKRKK